MDTETGEASRGRIDATPAAVAGWEERFAGRQIDVAVEAYTGWLFVCDALVAAGATLHLAEPVETRALRGRLEVPQDARADRDRAGDGRRDRRADRPRSSASCGSSRAARPAAGR